MVDFLFGLAVALEREGLVTEDLKLSFSLLLRLIIVPASRSARAMKANRHISLGQDSKFHGLRCVCRIGALFRYFMGSLA